MKVRVLVRPRAGVLDPQGRAVARALADAGFVGVASVQVGRIIELELDETDPDRARERARAMCEALLANPVVERWEIELG